MIRFSYGKFGSLLPLVCCVLLAGPGRAATGSHGRGASWNQQQVDKAIEAGVRFLLSQIEQDGAVKGEKPPGALQHGGDTAIAVYSLLAGGVDPQTPKLRRAIRWLMAAELQGTYATALRACALGQWNVPEVLPVLKSDTDWLIRASGADGAYTHTSQANHDDGQYDNLNSQFALLGVWSGAKRGIAVPRSYWQKVERHWIDQQQGDGGWAYRTLPHPSHTHSYGSMTAAGVASLFITFDALHSGDFVRIRANTEYKPITAGLDWIGKNFAVQANPGKYAYKYQWLFSIGHVGRTSGYKYFAGHNWYTEGARELITTQNDDGSWGIRRRVVDTSFAMLFLARGRYPVLINKLKYRGRWNSRPRDAANLVRWVSWNFERPVSWQVIDIESPLEDWHDAPILYISGAGACEFTDEQVGKLRTFVLQGGLILSEAAGNSGDFTLDVQDLSGRMFPAIPLEHVSEDHPIYNLHFTPEGPAGLMGISNGIRLLLIHSPHELSHALQVGPHGENEAWFELMGNIYLFATDKGMLRPRGTSHLPQEEQFEPSATITVTRLKYKGNYDPEPFGWRRLGIILANRYRLKLRLNKPVPIVQLDAKLHPVAVMTGTDAFELSVDETEAMKKYFRTGGALIIDAAGGSQAFSKAFEKQILNLPENASFVAISPGHPIYRSPVNLERISYRRNLAMMLGRQRRRPRLRGVLSGERLAIIYSLDDISAGMVGYQRHGIRGYTPASATDLMINIIYNLTGTRTTKIENPSSQPTQE